MSIEVIMNKSHALEWLIENVTKWPTATGGVVSSPKGWSWVSMTNGDVVLSKLEPTEMYADCHIEQQEWLDCEITASNDYTESIRVLSLMQYDWVERMGWHNKTVLEALALIASEVGEAVNECRGDEPTDDFGSELADIILRTIDLAQWQGIDIYKEMVDKMMLNEKRGTRGRRI